MLDFTHLNPAIAGRMLLESSLRDVTHRDQQFAVIRRIDGFSCAFWASAEANMGGICFKTEILFRG